MQHRLSGQSRNRNQDALIYFFDQFIKNSPLQTLNIQLNRKLNTKQLISLYEQAVPLIEAEIWNPSPSQEQLSKYQTLFHELESLIQQLASVDGHDNRYSIVIAIPVADRPQHLQNCLQSILTLCQLYQYGGFENQTYTKIKVFIADDSNQIEHIRENQQLANAFTQQGLQTEYFGAVEQQAYIERYNPEGNLNDILGNTTKDAFFHKGASVTRNITYLKLKEIARHHPRTLFQFIDSDQEFQINIKSSDSELIFTQCYGINYFYYLNLLFSKQNINILTGKVVGDPPVSPAVMASNLLDDLISFLSELSSKKADASCNYHQQVQKNVDDAAYHDMADLFGFQLKTHRYQYNCPLSGEHNHIDCLIDFSQHLNRFFDGEHPTRKSHYEYQYVPESIQPARTIYTGNYVFDSSGLEFFIPFSSLKLRMAGPTLGRLIKARIGRRFVQANLPMLHKRTVNNYNHAEFRAGVIRQQSEINISHEFIRQFYGDVMLFSIQELSEKHYPEKAPSYNIIHQTVYRTYQSLLDKYNIKHSQTVKKISTLLRLIKDERNWWYNNNEFQKNMAIFIKNMELNFGPQASAYQSIDNSDDILRRIIEAIISYPDSVTLWQKT